MGGLPNIPRRRDMLCRAQPIGQLRHFRKDLKMGSMIYMFAPLSFGAFGEHGRFRAERHGDDLRRHVRQYSS